jgi:TfoX N-terminal domain
MAYDENLANRIRELVLAEPGVTEKAMFGGLAFLIGGNMAVSASGQAGLLLRVDPDESDALLEKPHAHPCAPAHHQRRSITGRDRAPTRAPTPPGAVPRRPNASCSRAIRRTPVRTGDRARPAW